MKFKIKWQVRKLDNKTDEVLASGEVVKEAADRATIQAQVDNELMPLLKRQWPPFGDTFNREHYVTIEEVKDESQPAVIQ